ncbi:MAG: DinB family protein [Candidatus Eremiobacteraeota bacterium]|nr:DinB family protein [Candidatus Eremiobacteraeota bacterium]
MMDDSLMKQLREHLVKLLRSSEAHIGFDKTLADLPQELRGARPDGFAHSIWQLLEHLRIAQWDILEFSRDAGHISPKWPEGYWPEREAPGDEAAWNESLAKFRADLHTMEELVASPENDLFIPITHGSGQTILREALLVADHNAYHLGQVMLVRKMLESGAFIT